METKDTRLLIKLNHSKPVDLNEFTASLNAMGRLFSSYMHNNSEYSEQTQAKLYVETVKEGCIEVYLTELVTSTLIPFAENVNTIVGFAGFIKDTLSYFINGVGEKPNLSIKDCEDFGNVLAPVAGDNNGNMEIGAIIIGDNNTHNSYNITYVNANAGQNQFKREIENIKSIAPTSDVYTRQLMIIEQHRRNVNTDIGNKAIIDGISKKALPVVFNDDELKMNILNSDTNPTKKAYLVDVEVLTIREKMAAYKVLALHEIIDID